MLRAMKSAPALAAAMAAGCVIAAATTSAHADGDRALSASLGFATFSVPKPTKSNQQPTDLTPDGGASLAVMYEHGISTDLALRAEAAGGLFSGGNIKHQSALSGALLGDVGIEFRLDVLAYVPYAFAGVGGVYAAGGPIDASTQAVVVLGGGVDWLRGRDRSIGIEGRLASFAGDITVFTIGLRGSVRWGYF
jgi:hypothetical protein